MEYKLLLSSVANFCRNCSVFKNSVSRCGGPFYCSLPSNLAIEWKWGRSSLCYDSYLFYLLAVFESPGKQQHANSQYNLIYFIYSGLLN